MAKRDGMEVRTEQWPLLYRVFNGTIRAAADGSPPADLAVCLCMGGEGSPITKECPVHGERAAGGAKAEEEDPALKQYDVAISSEAPYERWFGTEVLSHGKAAVDMAALRNNAPLLWMHDRYTQIGSVKEARVDDDKVLRGKVRFLRASEQAQALRQGVEDGDISQISVGYEVVKAKRTKMGDPDAGTRDEYLITRWRPREVSVVSMAADQTVGFGRNEDRRK